VGEIQGRERRKGQRDREGGFPPNALLGCVWPRKKGKIIGEISAYFCFRFYLCASGGKERKLETFLRIGVVEGTQGGRGGGERRSQMSKRGGKDDRVFFAGRGKRGKKKTVLLQLPPLSQFLNVKEKGKPDQGEGFSPPL